MSWTDESQGVAPDAISLEEAQESEYKWRILVWAKEGRGKSHFAWTMPQPLAFIDTERKADAIVHKFDLDSDKVKLWQPTDFDEAEESLDQAIAFLDQTDEVGTIVVDSMEKIWEWAQVKYINIHYPGKDPEDVELKTAVGSANPDWPKIKSYHSNFRDKMFDTDHHICMTATEKDDIEEQVGDDNRNAKKAGGERYNKHEATEVIRLIDGRDNIPTGIHKKSGLVKHKYVGLEYPTFPKHRDLVREIEDAELNDDDPKETVSFDVKITEGLPEYNE